MVLDEIIDSTDNVRDVSSKLTNKIGIGVPIGNYLSQYFANLYLSELDHLCKEELKYKFYYRYADDIVILSDDKDFLHKVLIYIKLYVHTIGLKVKDNYQIYPVDSRGINFVGYVFYYTHTLIRKSIKYKIIRLVIEKLIKKNLKLECVLIMDGLNTLMLKIFFIKFKVLQVLDILIGMVKELILLNIMVNTLE
ncbi:MAG: MatK/TrnK amino terminal region [Bacteriophage sp.]|nr:MAG: MatK/TrnK amino terminal region [Bacteriophage sp.]